MRIAIAHSCYEKPYILTYHIEHKEDKDQNYTNKELVVFATNARVQIDTMMVKILSTTITPVAMI